MRNFLQHEIQVSILLEQMAQGKVSRDKKSRSETKSFFCVCIFSKIMEQFMIPSLLVKKHFPDGHLADTGIIRSIDIVE
jgi:hypothetical protein